MITFYIFFIVFLITVLHSIMGCITIPLRGAMIIDATGHAIVSGVITGFIIGKSLNSYWLFTGAVISALVMNCMISFFCKDENYRNKISYDAAIGISFSFLFSIGILLISIYARNIHLDLDMILLGNIEYAIYDTFKIFSFHVPKIIIILFSALIILLLILKVFWNSIICMLFDKEYAYTRGINLLFVNFILIIFNSIIIVSSFNAIGALILTGIATAPFAYSWNDSKSYKEFLINGLFYNCIFSMLGCFLSLYFNLPIGATVAFTTCFCSILKVLLIG